MPPPANCAGPSIRGRTQQRPPPSAKPAIAESRIGPMARTSASSSSPATGCTPWTRALARPSRTFGESGRVDLRQGLGPPARRDVHFRHQPRHRLPGPAHHGQHRQRNAARVARRYPRLRRAHRQNPLDLPHHSAPRRIRLRDLAERCLAVHRRRSTTGPA